MAKPRRWSCIGKAYVRMGTRRPRRTSTGARAQAESSSVESAAAKRDVGALLSEKDFQQQIVDLARTMGWRVFHVFDSRRSDPGFPDLVLVRGPVLLFLELKSERGRIQPEQAEWIAALKKAKIVEADIVRPNAWAQIEAVLTSRAR